MFLRFARASLHYGPPRPVPLRARRLASKAPPRRGSKKCACLPWHEQTGPSWPSGNGGRGRGPMGNWECGARNRFCIFARTASPLDATDHRGFVTQHQPHFIPNSPFRIPHLRQRRSPVLRCARCYGPVLVPRIARFRASMPYATDGIPPPGLS